jgi:hypothetical protein
MMSIEAAACNDVDITEYISAVLWNYKTYTTKEIPTAYLAKIPHSNVGCLRKKT